jgi:small neutral amino acid transporter SnatA (MarC family)
MVLAARATSVKNQGLMHDLTTRFMGLIAMALGVQFMLSGLKQHFSI